MKVGLQCQTPTLMHCVPCRDADCTIFIMVFGMTRSGDELTTYCMRGGHANSPGAVGWNLVLSDKVFFSVVSGSLGVA